MSDLRRNWLSSSEISRMSGFTERHVRRARLFDAWRVGYPRKRRDGKHHRFVDDPELREFCEYLLSVNSLDADHRGRPWERYIGKPGEGLRLFYELYRSVKRRRDKAAILAGIANLRELIRELLDVKRHPVGRDEAKLSREIRKIGLKWQAMITEGKLPTSTTEMLADISQRQQKIDEQRLPARKTPTV